MNCPRCRTRVASSQKFCGDCGEPLPWVCHACGSGNAPRNRFCVECGASGAAAPNGGPSPAREAGTPSQEPERRQLTIMFADLIGSTALSVRAGTGRFPRPDACVARLRDRTGGQPWRPRDAAHGRRHPGLLRLSAGQRGGRRRAVRAGLAIIEAVGRLLTTAGPRGTLGSRIGLATGPVIVGDLIGAGPSLEWSVVSETANLASRLQTLAELDSVVIDDVTGNSRRTSSVRGDRADATEGHFAAVRPWTVLRESAVESRFEALRTASCRWSGVRRRPICCTAAGPGPEAGPARPWCWWARPAWASRA